jgi:translocation protein SEC63
MVTNAQSSITLSPSWPVLLSQSLVRIPETLVCAMEFLTLKTPGEHIPAIDDLRKTVQRSNTEVKDKPLFMKRKASIVKVCPLNA